MRGITDMFVGGVVYNFDVIGEIEEFPDNDYHFLDWELRVKEAQRRSKPDREAERIRVMRETYAKAIQLTPEELRALRQVPRFHQNLQMGKNWSISEDLTILTLDVSKGQLAKLLRRTPHSIRKRWSILRQHGLHRRSVLNQQDEDKGELRAEPHCTADIEGSL